MLELLGLLGAHLKHVHSGKVRETFELGTFDGEELLLVVATDRVSVFDFVLGCTIPKKGAILTAMNVFWRNVLDGFSHDLVAYGSRIDEYLPPILCGESQLQMCATVVRKLRMLPIECIARGYLTGSGWKAYQETAPNHALCGMSLPAGLHDGSQLAVPLFTPTTKAKEGHDEHLSIEEVVRAYGHAPAQLTRELYIKASEFARGRGIIIADTKIEVGFPQGETGRLVFGDEALTPDSSRFWDVGDYEQSQSGPKPRSPQAMDKEYLRNHGKTWGIDRLDPKNSEHRARVTAMQIDTDVLVNTRARYHQAFNRLTQHTLTTFWRDVMRIDV